MAFIQLRSAPAQKLAPRPDKIISLSSLKDSNTLINSSINSALKALCSSGRFNQTSTTPLSNFLTSKNFISLHPEYAPTRVREFFIMSCTQAQTENVSSLGGINDPVVPHTCRRIIGRAFFFIFIQD